MLVLYNSREWFRVEKPVLFPIGVVLQSNENTFSPLPTGDPDAIQCEVLNTCCTFLYT